MKVLITLHELEFSGVPRISYWVAKALKERGHEVTILSQRQGPLQVSLIEMGCKVFANPNLHQDPTIAYQAALQHDIVYVSSLVLFNTVYGANAANKRVIFNISEAAFGLGFAFQNFIAQGAFDIATRVLFPSQWNKDLYKRFLKKDNYAVYNQGVPEPKRNFRSPFIKEPNKLYLLQVGSIEARKGQDISINAIQELNDPDVHLYIVGRDLDVNISSTLKAFVRDNKLNVHFVGSVTDDVLGSYLEHFDGMLNTSRDDLPSLATLEASMNKLPSIVLDGSGVKECVVHEKTGIVCKGEDFVEVASAIKRFKDVEFRKTLGENAKVYALLNYNFENFIQSYVSEILCEP